MSVPQHETTTADGSEERSAPSKTTPPTFGALAKRIRSRTTDLLAIAVIAVGAITVGTRVSAWLSDDEPAPPAQTSVDTVGGSAAGLGDEPLTLDFGGLPIRMHRRTVRGDRKAAVQEVLEQCRRLGTQAPAPPAAPSKAEQKLLARLADRKPVQELADGARLYRFDGPIAMVSLTRPVPPRAADAAATASHRVVCWGLAYPAGENQWTLSLFTPAGEVAAGHDLPVVPLPPAGRRILSIRGAQRGWRTFRSSQSIAEVRKYYESWFRKHGWKQQPQTSNQGGWTAVFTTQSPHPCRAEVQVSEEQPGRITGVLFIGNTSKQ